MKKIQIPVTRPDPEPVSENEDDSYDEDIRDPRSSRGGPGASRRHEKSWVRDRSASRERSLSPRSDRRSVTSSQPAKPTKVTLVKSRKNEGNLSVHLLLKLLLVLKASCFTQCCVKGCVNSAVTSLPILPVAGSKLKKCSCVSSGMFCIPKSVCLVKGKLLYSVNKSQLCS